MTVGAGLSTENFSAAATFINPADEAGGPWDVGFTFHQTPDAAQQVVIDSEGVWYYSPFPEGTLESGFVPVFDAAPGGANTIDLIVDGSAALLGVNGEHVATVELPPAVASDVQIGSGYFTNTTQAGRAIAYSGFEVWPLPAGSTSASAGAQEAPIGVKPSPTVSPSDAEAFAMLLGSQLQAAPLAGPFNANLTEEEGRIALSWADVNVADFHARAVFTVPDAPSEIPWNVGFMFRASPGGTLRVAVDSLGNWYSSAGTGRPAVFGLAPGLVTDVGGTNTIDLFVANDRAILGVNGTFVAAIDLAVDGAAADVAAGSSFYVDQTLPDRVTPFQDFVILPFDPDAVTVPDQSPATANAEVFAGYVAETEQVAPIVGPLAGRLVEDTPGSAPLAAAGVALADFGAVATFVNPDDSSETPWDAGFQFRSDATVTHRIAMGSNGDVYAVLPEQSPHIVGTAAAFDPAPGAGNALQLFVDGGRALVGVNGDYVATIELATPPLASDVQIGTAFFDEDFVQNRVTAYEGFSIWEMA